MLPQYTPPTDDQMSRPQPDGRQSTARTVGTQRSNRFEEAEQSQRRGSNNTAQWDSSSTIAPEQSEGMIDLAPRREITRQNDCMHYSPAGPSAPPPRYDQHQTRYSQAYLDANPWIHEDEDEDTPRFTMAGNFPRTVRFGKRKKHDKGSTVPEQVRPDEKGEREVAPQVDAAEDFGAAVAMDDEDHGEFSYPPANLYAPTDISQTP